MAVQHPTASPHGSATIAQTFDEVISYRLRSWNELYSVEDKRFFHAPDGKGLRTVEITRDRRIACRCGTYSRNLQQGLGPCAHVEEAIDFCDAVGYKRLPTWKLS